MHQKQRLLLFLLTALLIAIGFSLNPWSIQPVYADDPPPDYACQKCHGTNERQLTLPSGDSLPLLVPLDALAESPHHSAATEAVTCTACHRGEARYQYPHQPNPAQTQRDFILEVAENCERCHLSHNPLHNDFEDSAELPTCVDCHGSHNIDYAGETLNSIPAACLACHTDQDETWAIDLIPNRPGLGKAAEGYVGSGTCGTCHEDHYYSWKNTLHAKMIQDPTTDTSVILGNFNQVDDDLTFDQSQVIYTIGSRWKQRYITQDEAGDFYILPAQWNIESEEWVAYNADTWQDNEWRQSCGTCHVTGLDTETWEFAEFGVGCESCHGPGAEHAANPKQTKPFTEVDDQVCGSCHSRGASPDGFAFPATYKPGDKLTDHFTFTTAEDDIWPDGSAKKHRQQYMDWKLDSSMALSIGTKCVTCHAVHDSGIGQAQLKQALNGLCLQCHSSQKAIIEHVPFHEQAINKHEFICSDCHMPTMAISVEAYDIHNHSFLQPNPQASLDHGGLDTMLNACNRCHTDFGEDATWAAETIAYAKTLDNSSLTVNNVFRAGPTPTSPPPPTPLPSVGQKADVEGLQVETGRWLRNSFFAIVGVIVIGILFLFFRTIKTGRSKNV